MNPFARVVQQGKRGRLAVGSTWISEPTIEAESYCGRINTAFNARVDEEVKVALAHQEMELFSEKKIAESIEKAVKKAKTCRESGGTDSVCLKGHEDSMKEVRERERKAVAERDARIKGLEAEILESARLHGMGSQREAALKARIAELEKALEKHNKMHGEWTLILLSDGRVTNIPGFETEEACVCAGKNILLHWNWPYVKFVCVNTNGNVKGDR